VDGLAILPFCLTAWLTAWLVGWLVVLLVGFERTMGRISDIVKWTPDVEDVA